MCETVVVSGVSRSSLFATNVSLKPHTRQHTCIILLYPIREMLFTIAIIYKSNNIVLCVYSTIHAVTDSIDKYDELCDNR